MHSCCMLPPSLAPDMAAAGANVAPGLIQALPPSESLGTIMPVFTPPDLGARGASRQQHAHSTPHACIKPYSHVHHHMLTCMSVFQAAPTPPAPAPSSAAAMARCTTSRSSERAPSCRCPCQQPLRLPLKHLPACLQHMQPGSTQQRACLCCARDTRQASSSGALAGTWPCRAFRQRLGCSQQQIDRLPTAAAPLPHLPDPASSVCSSSCRFTKVSRSTCRSRSLCRCSCSCISKVSF